MTTRLLSLRLMLNVLIWVALFLPWTGRLSIARAFQESAAFTANIGPSTQANVAVGLTGLLALFPLAETAALFSRVRGREPANLAWTAAWLVSVCGLALFPFLLAIGMGAYLGLHLSWGYGLYGVGLLAVGIVAAPGQRRRKGVLVLLAALALGLGVTSALCYPWPQTVAFVNATLIDGTGRAPVRDAVVVVRSGYIAAAGTKDQVSIPRGARQIDLEGATLLPGIIDAHVHNVLQAGYLKRWAKNGVTTVCDMGMPLPMFFSLTRDLLAPYPNNARLAIAGPILTVPDGYPIAVNHFPSLVVTSPEDAEAKTSFLAGEGVDVVKTALTAFGIPSLSEEELRAIARRAHQHGRRVRVHQTDYRNLQMAVRAGVDIVDHSEADWVTDELIGQMVDQQVVWVPTIKVTQVFFHIDTSPVVQRFVQAGGRVAMGTDAGYYNFLGIGLPVYELEFLGKAGLDPLQVIVAATKNSAYACGIEDEVGTVEPGKAADLLVVDGDPLKDIHALEKVRLVMRQGVVIHQP